MNQNGAKGRIVAVRQFQDASGNTIVATLYEPLIIAVDQWKCAFQISGIVDDHAYGLDGLQALLMGLEGLRVHLEAAGDIFTWAGGEPGESGIPRSIPIGYGLTFQKHLAKVIDDEVAQLLEAEKQNKARP